MISNRLYCSNTSIKQTAETARLIQVDTESSFLLWELSFKSHSDSVTQYESDNTQGEYCVYEK
jgi:hypothetical protein